jgi:hypothetical protein
VLHDTPPLTVSLGIRTIPFRPSDLVYMTNRSTGTRIVTWTMSGMVTMTNRQPRGRIGKLGLRSAGLAVAQVGDRHRVPGRAAEPGIER